MVYVKKTITGLFAIAMGVQILLGLVWIGCNLGSGCFAQETVIYEKAAQTLVMDEYVGVLYPLLIRLCQLIMGLFGLSYEILLYVLQLIVALFCGCAFLQLSGMLGHRGTGDAGCGAAGEGVAGECECVSGECGVGRRIPGNGPATWFLGAYFVTIPLCVQWHLTVLPRSFVCSLYLLFLGICINVCLCSRNRTWKQWYRMCGLWAAMTLLAPDYWWLGLLPVVVAAGCMLRDHGSKGIWKLALAAIIASVLSCTVNLAVQVPGSEGRIQKTLGAALVSRFVWPNFDTNYFFWPDEVKEVMDTKKAREISLYAGNVQSKFGPLVEGAYGREQANLYYWDMALQCFGVRTKEVLQAVFEDLAAYLLTPWSVKDHLDGGGLSYSGWNYSNMKENTPRLTRYYMDFGLVSFRIGILTALILFGIEEWKQRKMQKPYAKSRVLVGIFMVSCVLLHVIWYTMSGAGMMDYGNVLPVILMWYLPIVSVSVRGIVPKG